MKYCSFEARKVLDAIEQYGITIDPGEYFDVEAAVGAFWNTHIVKIIEQVMKGGDATAKIKKAEVLGWKYFEKPIISMLTPRGGASRNQPIVVQGDWNRQVYNLVTGSLLLADFNMTELGLLVEAIPNQTTEIEELARAMQVCRDRNSRTIYYLHGIIQREYQTRQGRIKEIQERTHEVKGFEVDPHFEKLDTIERMELAQDWREQLENIKLSQALTDALSAKN